jgi:hypothetical protein
MRENKRMNRKSLSRFAFVGTAIILAVTISTRTASASSSGGADARLAAAAACDAAWARLGSTVAQNSVFSYLNDSIEGITNSRVALTGNMSFSTNSSGKSVDLRGSGSMVYGGNFWDVPSAALLPIISN